MASLALEQPLEIRPQDGPQTQFLASSADIAIAGGAAGGGKTYGLCMEPARHALNPHAGAVIFRRTYPQITNEGGLWDEVKELYPYLGAKANQTDLSYTFPSGCSVKFAHLQYEKDAESWKGSQIPLLGFDQLEEFTEAQWWYLLTRNRSARAGFRPYVRATCNPVPDDDPIGGWLNKLLQWWWDPETGYPIKERANVVRWFVRVDDQMHWADTKAELEAEHEGSRPKSMVFIPATLADNPILEKNDPDYRASLMAQPRVIRERLLGGNWLIKATKGLVFNRSWFGLVDGVPDDVIKWVRYWDKAGTEGGGKWTAGVLMGKRPAGRFIVPDVVRGQWSAGNREKVMLDTARLDKKTYGAVDIWVEQEPGSGGKESAEATKRNLAEFTIRVDRVTGSKLARSGPVSACAEPLDAKHEGIGNVDLVKATWTDAFLSEAQNFDGQTGVMDQIDGLSGAYNKLNSGPEPVQMRNAFTGELIGAPS